MMTTELRMLALSVLLGILQLIIAAAAATKQRGVKWNLSPRDATAEPLHGVAGRLERAFNNFKETFPFFLAAVFLVTVLKLESATTALGAQLYFFARVLYVPFYANGIPVIRTAIWGVGSLGILMMLWALL